MLELRTLFFEDLSVGMIETLTKTVASSDVIGFAQLTGDRNPIHLSEHFAAKTPFGRRIAHGLLTLSISSGLTTRMNLITDTVVAFYGIDKLRFVKPVFIGDTIYVKKVVLDTMAKGGVMGVVTFDTTVLNQNNESVLVYRDKLAIKKRP